MANTKNQRLRTNLISSAALSSSLFICGLTEVAAEANLLDIRVGKHQDHVRVVLDVDSAVSYQQDASGALIISGLSGESAVLNTSTSHTMLDRVLITPTAAGAQLKFESRQAFSSRVFVLTPDYYGGHRIVIDLYEQGGAPTGATYTHNTHATPNPHATHAAPVHGMNTAHGPAVPAISPHAAPKSHDVPNAHDMHANTSAVMHAEPSHAAPIHNDAHAMPHAEKPMLLTDDSHVAQPDAHTPVNTHDTEDVHMGMAEEHHKPAHAAATEHAAAGHGDDHTTAHDAAPMPHADDHTQTPDAHATPPSNGHGTSDEHSGMAEEHHTPEHAVTNHDEHAAPAAHSSDHDEHSNATHGGADGMAVANLGAAAQHTAAIAMHSPEAAMPHTSSSQASSHSQPPQHSAASTMIHAALNAGNDVRTLSAERSLDRGDATGACAAAQSALIHAGADNLRALAILGGCRLELGDANGARTAFSDALSLDPSYQRARLGLAEAEARSGNTNIARTHYSKVLASSPPVEEAYEIIAALQALPTSY